MAGGAAQRSACLGACQWQQPACQRAVCIRSCSWRSRRPDSSVVVAEEARLGFETRLYPARNALMCGSACSPPPGGRQAWPGQVPRRGLMCSRFHGLCVFNMSGLVCLNTHARDELHTRQHATCLCAMSMRPQQQTEASALAVDRRCLSAHMVGLGHCAARCLSWGRFRV